MALLHYLIGRELASAYNKKIDEEILYEGAANLFFGAESVGGKLFLTNQFLIFYSHKINVSSRGKLHYIELSEILEIRKGFLFNIMNVCTQEKKYKLVVWNRSTWIKKIDTIRSNVT